MSELTLNGAAVSRATILVPYQGAWVAEVESLTETAPSGAVRLVAEGGPTWLGTVARGGVVGRVWRGLLVGGGGGLSRRLEPRAYQDARLADVVSDVCREAGETLASDVDDLASVLAFWHRHRETAGQTLGRAAALRGYVWRIRADGAVWLGTDAWGDAAGDVDAIDVVSRDPSARRCTLRGDTLGLLPGTLLLLPEDTGALEAVRLLEVRHTVEPELVSTVVVFE